MTRWVVLAGMGVVSVAIGAVVAAVMMVGGSASGSDEGIRLEQTATADGDAVVAPDSDREHAVLGPDGVSAVPRPTTTSRPPAPAPRASQAPAAPRPVAPPVRTFVGDDDDDDDDDDD